MQAAGVSAVAVVSLWLQNEFLCLGSGLVYKQAQNTAQGLINQLHRMKSNPRTTNQQPLSSFAPSHSPLRLSSLRFDSRASDLYLLRNSFSTGAIRNFSQGDPSSLRHSNLHAMKKKQHIQSLKETLDKLQSKVKAAKEKLQAGKGFMKKKSHPHIHFQQEVPTCKQEQATNPTDSSTTLATDRKLASLITSVPKPKNFQPVFSNPYSSKKGSMYYISEARRAVNQKNSLIVEHIGTSIRIMKQCAAYQMPNEASIQGRKLSLNKSEGYKDKKTLVLDLDETLIHCVESYEMEADLKLSIRLAGDQARLHYFAINIRPYALTFLKNMASKFEIIIFTASQKQYADAILDQLDPDNEIFQHRLYRQHCWVLPNQMHVKDLRIINRNLSEMVLVDNAAYSYCFQPLNGIPILPFYEGSDFELPALERYLDSLARAPDVRPINKQIFKLHHYTEYEGGQELIGDLYIGEVD